MNDARPAVDARCTKVLIGILIVGLSLRVTWGLTRPVNVAQLPDQREYLELASNLLHEYFLGFRDERLNVVVRGFRMPGYPAFMAMCGAGAGSLISQALYGRDASGAPRRREARHGSGQ